MSSPLHPRKIPPYRVHWNWETFKSCNYRCRYCPTYDNSAPYLRLPVERWREIWHRLFEKYGCGEIRFSGGEPTIYPDFMELVAALREEYTINITTNLSFDAERWIRRIKPGNVFLSASLHPDHTTPEDFLEKVRLLRRHGHHATVSYVAYPPQLGSLRRTQEMFEAEKVIFKIIPFNGEHEGKRYPDAYSEEERALMRRAAAESAEPATAEMNKALQDFNLKEAAAPVLCRMGEMYAKIEPDGTVRRCCSLDVGVLGDIIDPDLRLYDEPRPCEARCKCWKPMIPGRYEAKAKDLWHMPEHTGHKTAAPQRRADASAALPPGNGRSAAC